MFRGCSCQRSPMGSTSEASTSFPNRLRSREFDSMTPSHKPETLDMASILADTSNRVVVCCGAGGVGKTTTAAAMALRAAEYGRTVVVLTIDPAKRLAQALGVNDLGNT